ncbi:flagellar hook-length control protein FliK [Shewanella khirikhana]|uniref:Flagellar hook-length control protein n=1 Tax=Shewanella khirikhana TaxID=1965282 RepID=A0ABM7DNT4_9GAMM|nr:flagellar hook-length control protein FliK [Shewanella khirikhana]AZQ11146.1 flagellar hook-length control protein [Shewanella khirikhana]
MQQIMNVLLSSPEVSQGASKGAPVGADSTAERDGMDFESIIAKTNAYAENPRPKATGQTAAEQSKATRTQAQTLGKAGDAESADDVSNVLAQIQFSRQIADPDEIAADGDLLPQALSEDDILALVMQALTADGLGTDDIKAADEVANDADAIATDDLFALFSDLMKGADSETRQQLADLLGVEADALASLDGEAFAALLQASPALKDALEMFAAAGLDEGVFGNLSQATSMATQVSAAPEQGAANAHANADGARALSALIAAAQKAPEGTRGLEIARSAVMAAQGNQAEPTDSELAGLADADGEQVPGLDSKLKGRENLPQALLADAKTEPANAQKAQNPLLAALAGADNEIAAGNLPKDKTDVAAAVKEALAISSAQGTENSAKLMPEHRLSGLERAEAQPAQDTTPQQGFEQRLTQLQRGDLSQVQLSLRHGNERPVTTADMVARFAPVMNAQLVAMVRDGVQQAEIRLDPPELGSMMVRIQVQGSETQVQFHVSAAQTKDVVEQALPRLRELLAQQGMELTDGQVSHDKRGNGQSGDGRSAEEHFAAMDEIPAEELQLSVNQTTSYASGIDYYA